MANHRFRVGDEIEVMPGAFTPGDALGRYTVTRLLPNDSPDREYRVRQGQGGQERVVRESEVRRSLAGTPGQGSSPA